MSNALPSRLQELLESARGLGEPRFDAEMRITNWHEQSINETKQFIEAFQTCGKKDELRACVDLLNANSPTGVPDGLLIMLSHVVFDNPTRHCWKCEYPKGQLLLSISFAFPAILLACHSDRIV